MDERQNKTEQDFREEIYHILFLKDWRTPLQMVGFTLLLLTIQVWQLQGYGRMSLVTYLGGIICLVWASFTAIRLRHDPLPQFQKDTIFLLCLEIISLLYLVANTGVIGETIGEAGHFLLVLGPTFVIEAQLLQLFFTAHDWEVPDKAVLTEIGLLAVLCLVFGFLLNIEVFNTWPRWDTYHYYHAFEFKSAQNIFSEGNDGFSLKLCGHISTSYALWGLIFKSIPGITGLNALYLSNMVLLSIDVVLFYLIFKRLLPSRNIFLAIGFAAIAACSPYFLGSVANLNAEHILVTGVLLLLYAVFSGNHILSIFSTFVVCTARETGAVVAAAIIFVQLVYAKVHWIKKKEEKVKVNWCYYLMCLGIGGSWALQYLNSNWATVNQSTVRLPLIDGSPFNHFGVSLLHIGDVLVASLITGFNWIFSLLILVALGLLVYLIKQKKAKELHLKWERFVMIAAGLTAFLLESAAYITYNLYRYYTISSALLCVLGLCSLYFILEVIWKKAIISHIIATLVGCLLLAQSYATFDPVTKALYPAMSTGSSVVVPLPQHTEADIDPSFTDSAYSNRQVLYFDKTLDKAYRAIYDDCAFVDAKVLFSNEYRSRVLDGKVTSGSLNGIWGFGYTYVDPPMWGEWNSEGSYRYLSYEPEAIIDPSYVLADTDLSAYTSRYEHVYYIEMPWGDTVLEPLRERYPDISLYQTIKHRGWVFNIYRIK